MSERDGYRLVFESHCSEEQPKIPPSENSQSLGKELGTRWRLRGFSASHRAGPLHGEQGVGAEQSDLGKESGGGTGWDKSLGCSSEADPVSHSIGKLMFCTIF